MTRVICGMCVAVALCVVSSAIGFQVGESHGREPYTPSQLQWLIMDLNATLSDRMGIGLPLLSRFGSGSDDNTIVLQVVYRKSIGREELNNHVEYLRHEASLIAKSHGWDKWVTIKERVTAFPT
jgi:hypothetical protein